MDFYSGQLGAAFERIFASDVSFVMYYAPWDAESQAVRAHFANVARFYRKQVFFAAVNCWQPRGECRQHFPKVQQFPVLVAYVQHTKGVQYKGVKEAGYMAAFLASVLRPLERVRGPRDVLRLAAAHDALVVGFVDLAGPRGGSGFPAFYLASLKLLERDPLREVGVAVATGAAARGELGVGRTPSARLYLWNETLEFPPDQPFEAGALADWAWGSARRACAWVTPPGVKSLALSSRVEEGPTLMLFTPRSMLPGHNWMYKLLYELALDYYNCDGNLWVSELVQYLRKDQIASRLQLAEEERACAERREARATAVPTPPEAWSNGSCAAGPCADCQAPPESCPRDVCWRWAASDGEGAPFPARTLGVTTSMLRGDDERSARAVADAARAEECRWLARARAAHPPVFPRGSVPRSGGLRDLGGLACRTNRTLSFLAVDSQAFGQFAEALGADVLVRRDQTVALILSPQEESTYVLEGGVNRGLLTEFVLNYTRGTLRRSVRSAAAARPAGQLSRYPERGPRDCGLSGDAACVPELTADDFLSTVLDPGKAVVVFYHSPYCAFCHGVAHVYLTVARYFRAVDALLFARVDGESNDLPWEYAADRYPTVLFFPARRKSESRVFPRRLPLTVPNLVNFVLANLGSGGERVHALAGLCAAWDARLDAASARGCLARARAESLRLVARSLARLREAALGARLRPRRPLHARSRVAALLRLQHARDLHLLLGSVNRLAEHGAVFARVRASFRAHLRAVGAAGRA
ncbi:thioredoxin domain-containing protein 11 isoform X2 [Bacillus rossius redtenbacheri]